MRPLIPIPRKDDAAMKFSRLAADYIRSLRTVKKYSEHTATSYDTAYQQFLASFTGRGKIDDIKQFNHRSIADFVQDLADKGASPNTTNSKLVALGSLARYAMRQLDARDRPLLERNPVDVIERPQHEEPEEKYLLPAELAAFEAAVALCPMRERVAMTLLLDAALRSSELAAATWSDLVEMAGGVLLTVAVKGRGTRRRKKLFPLYPETVTLLGDWRLARNMPDPGEVILLNAEGKPMNRSSMHYLTLRIAEDAILQPRFDVTPHVIRHTVNLMRNMGQMEPNTRSQFLGHSSTRSRDTYEHVTPDQLLAAKAAQRVGHERYLGR